MTPDEEISRLEELRRLEVAKATGRKVWRPEPHQVAPPGRWYGWLLLAGRGAGKTDACADYYDRWMRRYPGARGSIIAPTLGDAFEACIYGPSGLLAHNPRLRVRSRGGGTVVLWPNDSEARLFGCHTDSDVERLRAGGNRGIVWCEELAAWRRLADAWWQMEMGLRVGAHPHWIASTTPKTRPKLKEIMGMAGVVITTATTHDNPHLPADQKARIIGRYEGTRLGRQEIGGEYIEDVEGALWTWETLDGCRIGAGDVPDLARVVVAVDPSGGDSEGNDEQGILVCGRSADGRGYVVADRSCKLSPEGWGRRAVQAYVDFDADRIVAEKNFGGEMVASTVRVAARDMGVTIPPVKLVSASRGKAVRAEPISALYEQGRVKHAGSAEDFEELELQMRTWTQESGWSPDRMDACVWAFTELLVDPRGDPIRMRSYVPQGRIDGEPVAAGRAPRQRPEDLIGFGM